MANEKRLIKADPIANGIALYVAENAYLNDTALDVLKMVAKWIEEAPTVDAVEVCYCDSCVDHGNCLLENIFRMARIEKPYCCAGKMDGDGNERE